MATFDSKRMARYQAELSGSSRGGPKLPLFNLPSGTTRVRILPGMDPGSADKDFFVQVYLHYNVNPASKIPVLCTRTKDPRDYCPICNKVRALKASPNKIDQDEAANISVRIKYALGVIPRDGDNRGKAMIYLAPKIIWTKIIQLAEDEDYGNVTDPIEGYDVKLIKSGSGRQGTTYDLTPVKTSTPLCEDPDELEEYLTNQPEIWRFREVPDKEDITAFMNGERSYFTTGLFAAAPSTDEAAEPEEDEPAPPPAPTRVAKNVVRQPEPEPEEEEEVAPPPPPPAKSRFANLDAVRKKLAAK